MKGGSWKPRDRSTLVAVVWEGDGAMYGQRGARHAGWAAAPHARKRARHRITPLGAGREPAWELSPVKLVTPGVI